MALTRSIILLAAFTLLAQARIIPATELDKRAMPFVPTHHNNKRYVQDEGYCACFQRQEGGPNIDETLTQDICSRHYAPIGYFTPGDYYSACFSIKLGQKNAKTFAKQCNEHSKQPCKYFGFCCDSYLAGGSCNYIVPDDCPVIENPGDAPVSTDITAPPPP